MKRNSLATLLVKAEQNEINKTEKKNQYFFWYNKNLHYKLLVFLLYFFFEL